MEASQHHILQSISASIVLGALGLLLGRLLRVPSLLFFMLLGVLFGPTFFNAIHTELFQDVLMPVIEVAVAIIIFEAGLALPSSALKTETYSIRRMITIALPVTGILTILAARFVAGLPWESSVLYGTLIVVTGPTVIGPLLKSVALKRSLDRLFRWESVWADCVGVLISGLALQAVLFPTDQSFMLPAVFIYRLILGVFVGGVFGFALGRWIVPWSERTGDTGLPGVVVLASAVGVFYLSNMISESSGIVAAATAGLVLGRQPLVELENIKHFKDQVTSLIVAFLFVLLSAQIDLTRIEGSWLKIIITAALLVFIIRPIASLIALFGSKMKITEQFYVGFMGPRGVIAAAVVSYYGVVLSEPHFKSSELILLTFATIFISGGFASVFGKPLANLLKVSLDENRTGIIVVGYGRFSSELAKLLDNYVDVVMLDSNPMKCRMAHDAGLHGICGNALSDEIYEELLEEGFRRVIILTNNTALNNLIASKARNHFGSGRIFLSVSGEEETEQTVKRVASTMMAFSCEVFSVEIADRMLADDEAEIRLVDFENPPAGFAYVPLAFETSRGGIKIARKKDKPKGKAICFTFSDKVPLSSQV